MLVDGGSYSRVSNYTLPEYDKALARCNVYIQNSDALHGCTTMSPKYLRHYLMGSFENYIYPTWISYFVFIIMYQYGQHLFCFLCSVYLFLEDHIYRNGCWRNRRLKKQGNSETSSHLVGTGNVETLHPTHTAEEVPDKIFTVWEKILHCIVSRLWWVWVNGTFNLPPD